MSFKQRFQRFAYLNCLVGLLLSEQSPASDEPSLISSKQFDDNFAGNYSQGYKSEERYRKLANDRPLNGEQRFITNAQSSELVSVPFDQWTQRRSGFQNNGFSEFKISIPDFNKVIVADTRGDDSDVSSIVIVGESLIEAKENITTLGNQTTVFEAKPGDQSETSTNDQRYFFEAPSNTTLRFRIKSNGVTYQDKKSQSQTKLSQGVKIDSSRDSSITISTKGPVANEQLTPRTYSSDEILRDLKENVEKDRSFHAISAKDRQLKSDFLSVNGYEVHDRINERGELLLGRNPNLNGGIHAHRLERIKSIIERALRFYYSKPEEASIRTHWGMMHQIMIFGSDTQILDRKKSIMPFLGWQAIINAEINFYSELTKAVYL